METGIVFNIQRYSVHDGPGIRTVVFLKGCPLSCKWCANPESQARAPQLAWTKGQCIGCQSCKRLQGLTGFTFKEMAGPRLEGIVRADAKEVYAVCPSEALHVIGEVKTVSEVLELVERDAAFYSGSHGGMTLSGGEPFMQPAFTLELLREAKHRRIHCAVESSFYTKWEILQKAVPLLDTIYMDIKCMDDRVHKENTGVSNMIILDNLRKVRQEYPEKPMRVRTPVIPGVNDSEKEIGSILGFLEQMPGIEYELLKYHRFGLPKYESLFRPYLLGDVELEQEKFEHLKQFAQDRAKGITVIR